MSKKSKSVHVKLIANPGAGEASDSAHNRKLVTGYLKKNGLKVSVALAKPKGKATRIARQAVKDGYKIVIAMGGDGTVEAVMRGVIGSKTRLGIVPTGTENNIAKSLSIPLDLEEASVLIATGQTRELDIGEVKTRKGKKFNFFEMATVGLSAAIYPAASKVANGKLSNIKDGISTLILQETRPKVRLTIKNERKIKVETMLVMVSNTPGFGKNFIVAPGASLQDGLLDISVYPDFSKVELVSYYAAVMDGGYSGDANVQHFQAHKVKIKSSPKQDVMADGVALGKGTVTIKVLPGALRVISINNSPNQDNQHKDSIESLPEPLSPIAEDNHREKTAI